MDIRSILNPAYDSCPEKLQESSLIHHRALERPKHEVPPAKRQRLAKDAAIFTKCRPRGKVRFPPHEAGGDDALSAQYKAFQIHPMGNIGDYCRHIPYNSEKKSFLTKTGRDCFEGKFASVWLFYTLFTEILNVIVFQYEFKVPGEDKVYTVMWDYNIGLVRVTPFFKCCEYSKVSQLYRKYRPFSG